jgi:hypothetical protein
LFLVRSAPALLGGRALIRLEKPDEEDDDENQDEHSATDIHISFLLALGYPS